jgi:Flp pilus assembly protein TadG
MIFQLPLETATSVKLFVTNFCNEKMNNGLFSSIKSSDKPSSVYNNEDDIIETGFICITSNASSTINVTIKFQSSFPLNITNKS